MLSGYLPRELIEKEGKSQTSVAQKCFSFEGLEEVEREEDRSGAFSTFQGSIGLDTVLL